MPSLPVLSSSEVMPVRGEVRRGRHDRMLYATDASIYQVEPLGVVIPADIDDAVSGLRWCFERRIPVLPRGGGTSLAGQCTNEGVVFDFSVHCRGISEVGDRTCRVEPGITIDDLNAALESRRVFFAPDPATSKHANVGGCIGNNAAGARSIRYGRTVENLISTDVLLATGERLELTPGSNDERVRRLALRVVEVVRANERLIRDRFPKTVRRNAGYALDMILRDIDDARAKGVDPLDRVGLTNLIAGSEGTLGVVLGATLVLHPVPERRVLSVVSFGSVEEAIDHLQAILETKPSAVELLDDTIIELARANREYRRYVDLLPGDGVGVSAVLYVEHEGTVDEVDAGLDALHGLGLGRTETHESPDAMAKAWKLRKAGEPLLHGVEGDRKPISFVEDNVVPPERLGEFVRRFREIVRRHGTTAAFFAHASVGVLHVRPLLDITKEDDERRMHEIAVEVADLARELGGVMSGEHGDGRVRGPLLERHFGPELMHAFREIKAIFDPEGLLNPGNIVAPGPIGSISTRTRVRPDTPLDWTETRTYFEYPDGVEHAAEQCNGAGVCRKKSGGVMCPSYQALHDERHSTRGRANALRLALSGQFETRFGDEETLRTLDLCLSCKACKKECPSNVDVARLKSEYLAQSAATPWFRAMLLSNLRSLSRLASLTPGVVNLVHSTLPARIAIERLTGFDRRRSLPPFARRARLKPTIDGPVVHLFADCFSMHNEPDIVRAAQRVLEAFGYAVRLMDQGCCQRPAISNGLLPDAIRGIDRMLDAPGPKVFLEPSCHSAVVDDWPALRTREPKASFASTSFLLEDFLHSNWDAHPRRPDVRLEPIFLHQHCHQRAVVGEDSSVALLRRFGDVSLSDAGCCGMAGTFGFEHHDLSMRVGELRLLPLVRETDRVVCATGTSCRHQIRDATGVRALHPIEAIASALRG